MRKLTKAEINKRGCMYCTDMGITIFWEDGKKRSRACKHDECPYHELDNVENYTAYDKQLQKNSDRGIDSWLKKVFIMSEKYSDCQKST